MTEHVMPTPFCFLGTLPTCDGSPPLWSCPDSTLWPDPTIPCHAVVSVPVPPTGAADFVGGFVEGGISMLLGVLVLLAVLGRHVSR